jgi:hypothetical protein
VKVEDIPKSALERARARKARRKVSAGLTLYHESILNELKNDTPSFLSRMLLGDAGSGRRRGALDYRANIQRSR